MTTINSEMRAIRIFALFALAAIAFIMWYPQRYPLGIDLGNHVLQTSAFALCAFFWILLRGSRLGSDPYHGFRSNFLQIDTKMVRRNVIQIALELILLAGLLELGQQFLPNRVSTLGDFLFNALSVVAISVTCYGIFALALRTPMGRRLAQHFITID